MGDPVQLFTCPYCGARVLGDPVKHTFMHDAPTCERFRDALRSLGLVESSAAVVV